MGFTHAVMVYALGWFITAASLIVKMYLDGDVTKLRTDFETEMSASPDLATHWNENHHNIRVKATLVIMAIFVFLPIMFGSIWPVFWIIKLVNLLRSSGES